jgi:hypothetical protein
MSNSPNSTTVNASAMPAQTTTPLPPGSTSLMNAGYIKSQQQAAQQSALIGSGKTGGAKKIRGGASVVVPPVPAGTIDAGGTQANYTKITNLAQTGAANAAYDQSGSPAQTAQIAAQQQALYQSGGANIKWGCMSGGKTKRKYKKRKQMKKKNSKRKHSRRHLSKKNHK